jgi:redox-sensitive bicupin YhaK (pirin superfamily)
MGGTAALFTLPTLLSADNGFRDEQTKTTVVKNIKPLGFQWETKDPFLFCVHHEDFFPKGNAQMGPDASYLEGRNIGQDFLIKDGFRMYHGKTVPGFPGHPHRGFETITVVRKGLVDHADSAGASGRYGNGDVQWMTAGAGLQHSEMFPLLKADEENPMELFQIWLNLPKKNKMVKPHFKMLWSEEIPIVEQVKGGGKSKIEVIAGSFNGHQAPKPPPDSWAADPANEVSILNITLDPGAEVTLPAVDAKTNRMVFYYKGDTLRVDDQDMPEYHSAEVDAGQDLVLKNGQSESRMLVLQGMPIAEPVVQHGPFVMNSRQEIQEAFADYQRTQFGGWPWPRYDQVHDRDRGRFAKHADGRLEEKG